MHYGDILRHRNRATQYEPWLNDLKFDGISFPFTVSQLPLFERQNPTLTIRLLQWKGDEVSVLRKPIEKPDRRVVNILLVNDHFCGVSNLDRLLNSKEAHQHHKRIYCE